MKRSIPYKPLQNSHLMRPLESPNTDFSQSRDGRSPRHETGDVESTNREITPPDVDFNPQNEMTSILTRKSGRKPQPSKQLNSGSKEIIETNINENEYFDGMRVAHKKNFLRSIGMPLDISKRQQLCMLASLNIYFETVLYSTHDELFNANSANLKEYKNGKLIKTFNNMIIRSRAGF